MDDVKTWENAMASNTKEESNGCGKPVINIVNNIYNGDSGQGDIYITEEQARKIVMCLENAIYSEEHLVGDGDKSEAKRILVDTGYDITDHLSDKLGIELERNYIDIETLESKEY